jgi:hypothetical protein
MPKSQVTLPPDRIEEAAQKLARCFTEDADLPARFRRQSDSSAKPRKVKEDSEIEKRFRANVDSWARLIETMISKIDQAQAWRFIYLHPEINGVITKPVENKDFCDFIDYLILRREVEHCGPDELGRLTLLSVAFQRRIENRLL